ncbi:hypothetical protein MCOR34_001467 [Pyricularia oryzae]|nr:hypothetical protein MCOR01_006976 [Pyricularia oryzae]KAI6324379.1 hypothetical protein MCOR34_001467 [Pyricularia oryzae]KAI6479576.1 hypothetical protein MCOR11_011767 [Pyricularia oryzae]KAI6507139.1 hypothetical protein MCOR13_002936 [Pyricularia oryzae]KAI6526492.1 hypothetical protein MCOR05_009056 [Pyricularia oryzae]
MQLLGIEVWGWDRGGGNSKLVDVHILNKLTYPPVYGMWRFKLSIYSYLNMLRGAAVRPHLIFVPCLYSTGHPPLLPTRSVGAEL